MPATEETTMTNAFNWKRYTEEERTKRGEKPDAINTPRRRSQASTNAVNRLRVANQTYGTVGVFAAETKAEKA